MESLNKWLREEARRSYEETIAKIPTLIKYHDLARSAGEIFVSRGYGRSYNIERSRYVPMAVLRLESGAILSREVAFLMEKFEEKHSLQDYFVRQDTVEGGLEISYSEKRYSSTCLRLFFKIANSKTCHIVETKKTVSYETVERTIIC